MVDSFIRINSSFYPDEKQKERERARESEREKERAAKTIPLSFDLYR